MREFPVCNKDILDYVSKICKLVTYFLISRDINGYDYESFPLNELSKSYILENVKDNRTEKYENDGNQI